MDMTKIAEASRASQGRQELKWLLNKLSALEPKVIVEIGVDRGYSLKVWEEAFAPTKLIGIECDMAAFDKKLIFNSAVKIAVGKSWDIIDQVKDLLGGDKIDFLFIDGDHTYEAVKRDFELYKPLVRYGGIIAFHDACILDHPLVDVHRLFEELQLEYFWDSFQLDANGVGVIYV